MRLYIRVIIAVKVFPSVSYKLSKTHFSREDVYYKIMNIFSFPPPPCQLLFIDSFFSFKIVNKHLILMGVMGKVCRRFYVFIVSMCLLFM